MKRTPTDREIALLESQGCRAEDWSRVLVPGGFAAGGSFHDVSFSGDVELGRCRKVLRDPEGFPFPSGVSRANLRNVRIGDDVLIHGANIADADIGDEALIQHVDSLTREGDSPFANGSPAHVLAEDGARSVPLWRNLSSQIAHLVCHLKNHPAAAALEGMIAKDAAALRLPRSVVGRGCLVRRVKRLRNVWLGEGAIVDGAESLTDCHVGGSREAPVHIGEGAAAEDCVFLAGSWTLGGVRLRHCLVGEGVRLEDGFSAKHSLFFANSEFALGEAACAMTGPYAVSHHKATLVLACQCSFNTFGSAANSSNHHFKLGPLHGGVLRRGVRCGSGSYLFWPSDIGAFSTVVGRHSVHLDTADFPFSLLVVKGDTTVLVPGVNLFTTGSYRDAIKWSERDRRPRLAGARDLVNPAILSPYVLQAMEAGIGLLERSADMGVDLRHGGATIPVARCKPALRLYRSALIFHAGERLLRRAMADNNDTPPLAESVAEIVRKATDGGDEAAGRWRDWGGMLLPGIQARRLLEDLTAGKVSSPEELQRRLETSHAYYDGYELAWLARHWQRQNGEPTPEALAEFFVKWRTAVRFRHECLVRDAGKEFTPEAILAFGMEESEPREAFRRVRGRLADNSLIMKAEAERDALLAMADAIPAG